MGGLENLLETRWLVTYSLIIAEGFCLFGQMNATTAGRRICANK
jgi:hypothetical protein